MRTVAAALRPTLVALGLLALAPAPAPAAKLRSFELPSPLVDTSTPGGKLASGRSVPKVNVLLPDGYDADSKRGYPVLWLLHGANGGTESWIPGTTKLAGIPKLAAGFPGIVVMPDGGMFGMLVERRRAWQPRTAGEMWGLSFRFADPPRWSPGSNAPVAHWPLQAEAWCGCMAGGAVDSARSCRSSASCRVPACAISGRSFPQGTNEAP